MCKFDFLTQTPIMITGRRDNYKLKGLRLRMVKHLMSLGIEDVKVLQAMLEIPRHYFVETGFEEWAYRDQAFPIASDQTISRPYTVALQTSLLKLTGREKVLEIGTGSGYQTTVLSMLSNRVYTIERQVVLFKQSNKLFADMDIFNIRNFHGDGYQGLGKRAPFDRIIVTAGANDIPQMLVDQLAPQGIMVIPVVNNDKQEMLVVTKLPNGKTSVKKVGECEFVPFLEGTVGSADLV